MKSRKDPLAAPGLGYGAPSPSDDLNKRALYRLLALVVVAVLAVVIVVVLQQRPNSTGNEAPPPTASPTQTAQPASVSPSPSPSESTSEGTDASEASAQPTAGPIIDASTRFVTGWLDPNPQTRLVVLNAVATQSLTGKLADVDPAKINKSKPSGSPVVAESSDFAAVVDQSLSDGTAIRLYLVAEPTSQLGWLVDVVAPVGR